MGSGLGHTIIMVKIIYNSIIIGTHRENSPAFSEVNFLIVSKETCLFPKDLHNMQLAS